MSPPDKAGPLPASPPAIIVSNLRRIDKNRLLGTCDIYVARWHLHFRGCLWQLWERATKP
jgi:hypothetical protein